MVEVTTSTRPDTAAVRNLRTASPTLKRRLVICPAAGSGARSFRAFVTAQPETTEVLGIQYPGRGDRRHEDRAREVSALGADVAAELAPWAADPSPLVVFGHSYGAVVAFELTRALERHSLKPAALVVSGRQAPAEGMGVPVPRDDDDVVAELKRTGAVAPEALARPSMRRFLVSMLRDDFHANASYRVAADVTVDAPITFLHAAEDPYVNAAGARLWARHTTDSFQAMFLPGGHGFLDDDPQAAVAALDSASTVP